MLREGDHMSIKRILQIFMIVGVLPLMAAGQDSKLASVKTLQCTFPLIANGTWKNGKAEAIVKPATLTMKFVSINTDEGSAQLDGGNLYCRFFCPVGAFLGLLSNLTVFRIKRWSECNKPRNRSEE